MNDHSGKSASALSSTQKLTLFRHADGIVANTLAIGYSFTGYVVALFLLAQNGWLYVLGIFLLAHSLVIAAYLIHECTHGTLFVRSPAGQMDRHEKLATALSWLTGACYGDYQKIRDKHLRHHFERADIVAVDYRHILVQHPAVKRLVIAGQWLCLPAVELLMHALLIIRPFTRPDATDDLWRVTMVLIARVLVFALFGVVGGWPLLIGYAIAYLLFLTVLAFMDAFQHRYLLFAALDQPRSESPLRDTGQYPQGYFSRDYEDNRTYSNLFSARWPVLNLLVLNFCYHNSHHRQPNEPWYRLPRLAGEEKAFFQVIPFRQQVRDFFRYRTARVMAPATDRLDAEPNPGACGVSFLTPL